MAIAAPSFAGEAGSDREQCGLTREPDSRIAACTRALSEPGLAQAAKVSLLLGRSHAEQDLGNCGAALADVSEAIRLEPDAGAPYLIRAEFRRDAGDTEGALTDLGIAIDHGTEAMRARRARAELLLGLGRNRDALADLDAILAAAPDDGSALLERGVTRWRSLDIHGISPEGQNDGFAQLQNQLCMERRSECPAVSLALADIGRAIDLLAGADRATALYQRSLILAARGERGRALEDLDAALLLRPDEPAYYAERAAVHEGQGDFDGARTDLDKSLALKPADPDALVRRAKLRIKAGDAEGARADVAAAQSMPIEGSPGWVSEARDLRRALAMPGDAGSDSEMRDVSVSSVGLRQDPSGREIVSIKLDAVSGKRFAAFTTAHLGAVTQLRVDGVVVAEPRILSPIMDGAIDLSGAFTHDEAMTLATRLGAHGATVLIRAVD